MNFVNHRLPDFSPEQFCYREITRDIEVQVIPRYVKERSSPSSSYYFFSYSVKIINRRQVSCQLFGRHWIIRDGKGREEHIKGEGVVGLRPVILPHEFFEYTSFCPLRTPTGNMRGNYFVRVAQEEEFSVTIPLFFLRPPETFIVS